MGTVFLLHFEGPVNPDRPARHYLEYTARRVSDRLADHHRAAVTGNLGKSVPIVFAAMSRGVFFEVARVWPNATKSDERRLRDLRNNPRLCPICNPALGLALRAVTVRFGEFSERQPYTYMRMVGRADAYGNLAELRSRPLRAPRWRVRRDGTHTAPAHAEPATGPHGGAYGVVCDAEPSPKEYAAMYAALAATRPTNAAGYDDAMPF